MCARVLYEGRLQTPSSADAIIVLGAAAYYHKPSPVFEERIRHAVNLYKQGKAKKIIFTGGTPKAGFQTEAEVGAKWAEKNGVPRRDILLEPNSRNTFDNLKNAAEIAKPAKLHSFIVVSDPYHIARAKLMAEDLGLTVQMSPTPTSRFNSAALPVKLKFFFSEVHHYSLYCILRLPQKNSE
ncbi:MAG: YdcF family protein [Neisseriaceae bacterium]|nr:YdcF family protein [Neisseriaceae bacterium]